MRALVSIVAWLVAFELLVAGCGDSSVPAPRQKAGAGAPLSNRAADADGQDLEDEFVDVVAKVSPSVVQISTEQGLGSGVVYDEDGDVVTNNHVVEGSRRFTVTLADGRTHPAKLVGSFPPEDLAVIRLENGDPPPARFADSSELRVGQFAFAIGNPLGLRSSVTQGVISSLGRTVSEGENGAVVSSAIQTSAPINPGNSGGALADLDAQVVGIPTLAAISPAGEGPAPGIGFAIPANTAKRIADQLIERGRVTRSGRAYLGVQVASSLGGGDGVIVAGVERGSPAAKAGVRPGEVILAADGHPIASAEDLATVLATMRPGQRVELTLGEQSGGRRTVTVQLGELPG